MSPFIKVIKLVLAIVFCQGAGIIGMIFTTPAIATWYKTINKPAINPPNWIFGPVWFTLYTLMGVALFIVWIDTKPKVSAITVFIIQLALNAVWSIVFFGYHNPFYAFIVIIALWFSILFSIILFWKISDIAGYLLLPYIGWVTFAAFLNYSIWRLNG